MRVYTAACLAATLFAVFTRTFLFQAFAIPSGSMEPGLLAGDYILVNKFIYRRAGSPVSPLLPQRDIRRGDVVVLAGPRSAGPHSAGTPAVPSLIKRCLGLPGETVGIAAGRLSVDGRPIDEGGYLHPPASSPGLGFGPATVPARHYFCLGDHRDRSRDSRSWGPVAAERLVGRAVVVCWSVRPRADPAENWADQNRAVKGSAVEDGSAWSKMGHLVRLPVEWIRRFRWERCLKPVR